MNFSILRISNRPARWLLSSLWLVLLPLLGWGQTIKTYDFESASGTPTLSGGATKTGSSGNSDAPASATYYTSPGTAFTVNNGTATVTSAAIDASTYSNISVTFRVAAFSPGGANGLDAGDRITLAISTAATPSYVNQVLVSGNNNATWHYTTGAASASRTYSTAPSSSVIAPTGGGARTSDGYSTITVTGIPTTATLSFQITLATNDARELWAIDDIVVAGTSTIAAAPTLTTTSPATAITQTSATLAGNISSFGSPVGSSPAYGFVYSLTSANAAPELNGTGTTTVTTGTAATTGTFSSALSSLTPNTSYSFQAYATNGTGTSYGGVVTFTTASTTAPAVTTATPSSPTSTGATLGGSVTATNGSALVEYGVVYSTTNTSPTIADTKVAMSNGPTNFSQAVALAAGTYYVRAYATNSVDTGYGNAITLVVYPAPTISSLSPASINYGSGAQTLTINGSGFVSGVTTATYGGASKAVTFVSANQLTIPITATDANTTTGTKQVVVTNPVPGGGSASADFTVQPVAPTATTNAASSISYTTATANGSAAAGSGNAAVTERGFFLSTTACQVATGGGTKLTAAAAGAGSYTVALTGLTPSTTYYLAAYATNSAGTSYGTEVSFTTLAIAVPTVTTATPSSFTSTGATLGGSVTATNGDAPIEYGVVYSTTANPPTVADSKVIMTNGPTNFNQAVALAVGTYYIRAYALNSAGAGYGSVVTLTIYPTPTITALSPNPVAAGSGAQTLTINGSGFISAALTSVRYNGGTRTVTFVSSSQLTIPLSAADVATAGSFPVVVTNGTPGGGSTTATLVVTQVAPTITTTAASAITSASATSGGSISSAGGGTISARGVVYSTSPLPRLGGVGVVQVANTPTGSTSFTSSLAGLTPGTTYYVAAYATNSTDTSYGSDRTFTTLAAPTITTTTVSPATVAAGNNLTVSYTTTGTFGTGNTFTAELSTVTGTYPGTVLTPVSTGSGTLTVTIPSTTAIGSAYTIRVLASSPATVGAASGAFTIVGPPLVSYTTDGLRSGAVSAPVFIVAPNITATDITRGPGVTNPNTVPAGTFTGSQFSTNATLDPASDDYFAFDITVAAGSTAAITNVVLNAYRSNGGPDKADLLYSTDGVTFNSANTLGSITLPTANTAFTFRPGSGALQSVAGTLYFRLYGYGINSSGSTGGLFYLADPTSNTKAVVVNGTTTAAAASLSASPTSLAFTAISGQSAPTQTYTLTGLNLAANASVNVASSDASVLVSLTGGAPFAQSATATASASGTLSQTVTVLYTAPATTGTANVTIGNTSGSLSAPVAVAATATATAPAPTITSFSPSSGTAGTAVLLMGTGFTGTTSVTFNGTAATTPYTINSAGTQLTAVVPGGATTGPIAVTTPGGTATTSVSFVVIQASPAGQLLLEENFDYPANTALSQTASTGWLRQAASNTSPNVTTATGNLSRYSYPQGAAFSAVNPTTSTQATMSGGSNAEDIYKSFSATQPSGTSTLYASALVSLSAAQTGDYFLNFYNTATATNPLNVGRVFAKAATGGYQLGISVNGSENAATYTPTMTFGNTYLVVLKYENTTGTDAASLFVFDNSSTALPITEPSTPTAGPVTSTIAALANLDAVVLRQGGTSSYPTLSIDNLRVASGWGSVIGQPVFTSSTATIGAGSYYSLRVAGSAAHATTAGTVAVEKTLDLDGGTITTTSANPLVLRYRAPSTPADDFQILVANGGTSYVDGPVSREVGAGVGLSQFFPIGRNGNYRPLTLNIDIAPSAATRYTAVQTEGGPADQTLNAPLTRISQARYFTLTPSPVPAAGTFSGNVELSFGSNEGVTDPSASTFVVAKNSNDGTHWTNIDRQSNTSNSLKSGSFQSFSSFILASTDAVTTVNPLPVQLTSFGATRVAAGVQVAWTTASEKNSAYFDVERSLDGNTFARVARMAAHGTTTQAHAYASLDGTAPAALLYYRLRQVDLDGTVAYSPVATVAATAGATAEFTLAPNPARERISFLNTAPTAYTVRNTLGQLVRSGTTTAGTNDLLVGELPAGVYFFELHGGAGRVVRKFVKE